MCVFIGGPILSFLLFVLAILGGSFSDAVVGFTAREIVSNKMENEDGITASTAANLAGYAAIKAKQELRK